MTNTMAGWFGRDHEMFRWRSNCKSQGYCDVGARRTEACTLDIELFALDGRRRGMLRAGFTEREEKPCMIPARGDRRFLDPDRWFYCGADSDLDSLD